MRPIRPRMPISIGSYKFKSKLHFKKLLIALMNAKLATSRIVIIVDYPFPKSPVSVNTKICRKLYKKSQFRSILSMMAGMIHSNNL